MRCSHALLDEVAIHDHIAGSRLVPAGFSPPARDRSSTKNARWRTRRPPGDPISLPSRSTARRRVRFSEAWLPRPLDFEEPDRDPDSELVRPDRGQVHHALEPLGAKIRALPPIRRRARTQVNVLDPQGSATRLTRPPVSGPRLPSIVCRFTNGSPPSLALLGDMPA